MEGLVLGGSNGKGISLPFISKTSMYQVFAGSIGGFPIQMIWGLLFAAIGLVLFNYHRFGARICCVGDNLESAREMGINATRVKTLAFVYVGISAGIAGVLSTLIYGSFWSASGAPFEHGVVRPGICVHRWNPNLGWRWDCCRGNHRRMYHQVS